MTFISPLTDQRKRRPTGVMEDGEYLGFEVAFADAASAGTVYLTDTANITRRADFSRALAAARFADGAKLIDMHEGSTRAIGGTASAYSAGTQDAAPARASIDAIRAARYQG